MWKVTHLDASAKQIYVPTLRFNHCVLYRGRLGRKTHLQHHEHGFLFLWRKRAQRGSVYRLAQVTPGKPCCARVVFFIYLHHDSVDGR